MPVSFVLTNGSSLNQQFHGHEQIAYFMGQAVAQLRANWRSSSGVLPIELHKITLTAPLRTVAEAPYGPDASASSAVAAAAGTATSGSSCLRACRTGVSTGRT